MRIFILLSFILGCNTSYAQTYSKAVSDSEIISFINSNIKLNHIQTISGKIYPLNINDFYFKDSADLATKNSAVSGNPYFIFRYHNGSATKEFTYHLDSIFSREDIDFFKTQIDGLQEQQHWKRTFKHALFNDDTELDERNLTKLTIHNYSIPLFSADKKKAIIIRSFYCGLLCGGGAYELYEKNANNKWKLVKKMNEWAE